MIFWTDKRHGQRYVWNIHTFMVGYRTWIFYGTDNVCISDFFDGQPDQTIVDQNTVTRLHIVKQIGIGDGDCRSVTFDITGSKRKCLAFFQNDFPFFKIFQTDFRTLGVQK